MDDVPDGLVRFGHDFVCTFATSAASHLFERAPEKMLGARLDDLAGEDAAAVLGAADAARTEARVTDVVFRLRRAAGEPRWIEARFAPQSGEGGLVGCFRDITLRRTAELALRAANSALNKLAGSDALTDLANRHRFDQMLDSECRRASRDAAPLSLLLLEVDDFRSFGDLYGQAAADACLKQVADVLRGATARPADLAARLGGEEFALLLPQADEAVARECAATLTAAITALAIPHRGHAGASATVTVGIGRATATPGPDTVPTAAARLLADANLALHHLRIQSRGLAGAQMAEGREPSWSADDLTVSIRAAPGMQQIARIAAVLLGLPTAFVVVEQGSDLLILGHHGLDDTAVGLDWCVRALGDERTLVVPDTEQDPGFCRARAQAGFGFLAAAPLRPDRNGPAVGALWVADRVARAPWGETERRLLQQLAGLAANGLEPHEESLGQTPKVA